MAAFFQALYQLRDFSLRYLFSAALDIRAAALIPPLYVALAGACLLLPALAHYVGGVLSQAVHGMPDLPLYWCGTILFALCAVLSVDNAIRSTAEGWTKAELLSDQISALQGRVEATRAAEEAMRIERHDLRHRLRIVDDMVEKGEKAEALEFIGTAQARLEGRKLVCRCRNHPGLMFEVANTYRGEVRFDADGLPVSARRGHGIGVRSIAALRKARRGLLLRGEGRLVQNPGHPVSLSKYRSAGPLCSGAQRIF